ncbi:MAG: hypothetical protein ACRDDY_02555 [Clostridium sp.]
MSAKYIYTQIVRGGLDYKEVFSRTTWKKYQTEVDQMLIENGYENLIVK